MADRAFTGAGGLRELNPSDLPEYRDRLFRAAYALCRSREDAEDLVQETYARVLRRPRFLRRDQDLGYLLKVLQNTWHNVHRAQVRRPQTVTFEEEIDYVIDPASDPEVSVVEVKGAYAAVSRLSSPLRETLVAVDIVGLSYKQAAKALDVPVGTVMSRLHRARARVAAELEAGAATGETGLGSSDHDARTPRIGRPSAPRSGDGPTGAAPGGAGGGAGEAVDFSLRRGESG